MVGPKSTQTSVVGIITDEMYPYTFFIEALLLEIGCRDASHLLLFLLHLFVYFLALPSLLIYLVAFYTLHAINGNRMHTRM